MVLATSPVFGRETGNDEKIVASFEAKSLDLASPVLLTIDDYNKQDSLKTARFKPYQKSLKQLDCLMTWSQLL